MPIHCMASVATFIWSLGGQPNVSTLLELCWSTPVLPQDLCSHRTIVHHFSLSGRRRNASSHDDLDPDCLNPLLLHIVSITLSLPIHCQSVLGVGMTYNPTAGGALGTWANCVGGGGSGSTLSSLEISVGVSTSIDLFSNLTIAMTISLTMSTSWLMSWHDYC